MAKLFKSTCVAKTKNNDSLLQRGRRPQISDVKAVRAIFLGTAELARRSLQALIHSPEVSIIGVISQPDKPQGRRLRIKPTPVKTESLQHSLPVWQPASLRTDTALLTRLKNSAPDLILVAAYGQMLPPEVLEIPKLGCLNVHPSLLPKYRGAAPISWTILNGDHQTGVTIMKVDEGLDTGDIVAQETTPISPTETGGELHNRLSQLGAQLLVRTLSKYLKGDVTIRPQNHQRATYARKLDRRDGEIDWHRPALELANQIRGLNPRPGTFSRLRKHIEFPAIKFWRAEPQSGPKREPGTVVETSSRGIVVACGQDHLRITKLQRAGGKPLPAGDFLAGFSILPGSQFIIPTTTKHSRQTNGAQ